MIEPVINYIHTQNLHLFGGWKEASNKKRQKNVFVDRLNMQFEPVLVASKRKAGEAKTDR